jgi:metallophosphoesterase superfamily enzyme
LGKRIVVISDLQMPFEDRKALAAVIRFIGEYRPDEVIQIGDLVDYPQPSRWSKGTAAEFEGSVLKDSKYAQQHFFEPLREVYSGPVSMHEGNHDLLPVLLDLPKYRVQLLPDFHQVAPDWLTTHGHVGGITLSQISGNTALNGAKRAGKSLVMGHTHRQGIGRHTTGYGGKVTRTVTGVEVGHLMNMRHANYLKGATPNWQTGFAVLHIDRSTVTPELVPITARRFIVDGVTFKV